MGIKLEMEKKNCINYVKKYKEMNKKEKLEYHKLRGKLWRLKNPEKNKILRKKYKTSDKGKVANKKCQIKSYAKHSEKIKERQRKKYAENPKTYKQKKDYINNYIKEYCKNPENKEKIKIRQEAYKKHREKLLKKYPNCQSCGSNKFLEIHHEEYDNMDLTKLKVLCRKCHRFLHRI